MMGACYCLEFPNGKVYVGITTKTVEERFARHTYNATVGARRHLPLYRALRKYGPESVHIHTLAESEDWLTLCEYERMFIAFYQSNRKGFGYNATGGGEGAPDPSDEVREKISNASRERWADPASREKMSTANRERWADPASREKMSNMLRKRWADDPEYRERMTAARRQQKPRALAALSESLPDYGIYTGMGYTEPVDFVDRVRVAVQSSPLGGHQLARASGVSHRTIRRFATRRCYTDATLRKLADALGVTEDQLSPPT